MVCWEKAPEVTFYHCMHLVRSCKSKNAHGPLAATGRCSHSVFRCQDRSNFRGMMRAMSCPLRHASLHSTCILLYVISLS